ncbi:hypothetical protein GTA08_BOTSDO04247 [Neofusicoccum parvum]|nr:hypothetical protein GTA08_BOTSDO04247 [Neofusicoccum parvum]
MTAHKAPTSKKPSSAKSTHKSTSKMDLTGLPSSSKTSPFPQRATYHADHSHGEETPMTSSIASDLISCSDTDLGNAHITELIIQASLEGIRDAQDAMEDENDTDDVMEIDGPHYPIRNGVFWDTKLKCEARPMSKPCEHTINTVVLNHPTKCICGQPTGGKRVSDRHSKKHEYKGPTFVFNEKDGRYEADCTVNALSEPFKALKIDDKKTVFVPMWYTVEDYNAGKPAPRLSTERSVPMCAHFPTTGLAYYNVPFVKGRIAKRIPNSQCLTTRIQDQARYLCLIENEVRSDGTMRRRMNIHAPPSDWNDPALISSLNRWRAQFRQRKLGITSRQTRHKWTAEALNFMVDQLGHNPDMPRAELARLVTNAFGYHRTDHAVSCAIDNHNLRPRIDALHDQLVAEGIHEMFDAGDQDVQHFEGDTSSDDDGIKREEDSDDDSDATSHFFQHTTKLHLASERDQATRDVKMQSWLL